MTKNSACRQGSDSSPSPQCSTEQVSLSRCSEVIQRITFLSFRTHFQICASLRLCYFELQVSIFELKFKIRYSIFVLLFGALSFLFHLLYCSVFMLKGSVLWFQVFKLSFKDQASSLNKFEFYLSFREEGLYNCPFFNHWLAICHYLMLIAIPLLVV